MTEGPDNVFAIRCEPWTSTPPVGFLCHVRDNSGRLHLIPYNGELTECEQMPGGGWRGQLPFAPWPSVEIPGALPVTGAIIAIISSIEPYIGGIYRIVRMRKPARKPQPTVPPSRERDAEILSKREAGRTLRSLGKEYNLCADRIRGICNVAARRRDAVAEGAPELSPRTVNVIRNTLDVPWGPETDALFNDEKALAQKVAAIGARAFKKANNCGKITRAEIERWLNKHGLSWYPPGILWS